MDLVVQTRVLKYDKEVPTGTASRKFKGTKGGFSSDLAGDIEEAFADDATQTYREAGEKLQLPKSTLHRRIPRKRNYGCGVF